MAASPPNCMGGGFIALGTGTPEYIRAWGAKRLEAEDALLRQLPRLPDLQCAWLLLSFCARPAPSTRFLAPVCCVDCRGRLLDFQPAENEEKSVVFTSWKPSSLRASGWAVAACDESEQRQRFRRLKIVVALVQRPFLRRLQMAHEPTTP